MSSVEVVAAQPSREGCSPLGRAGEDRRVGPLAQHRADEALRLAVGLGPVGPGALVRDRLAQRGGEGVGAVARAVVGHQPLNRDPMRREEGDRALEEADRGLLPLVGQDLGVGEAGGVVDADVDAFVAGAAAANTVGVGPRLGAKRALAPEDPVAGPAVDPAQLLDVDVDQLACPPLLIAADRLGRLEATELAQADPLQHRRGCRGRHLEKLGDLGPGHADPPQRLDRCDLRFRGLVVDSLGRRAPVMQAGLALGEVAADPLAAAPFAHSGRLGGLHERTALLGHSLDHDQTALRAEGRVSVELHPDFSLDLGGLDTPSLQGGPDEQRA